MGLRICCTKSTTIRLIKFSDLKKGKRSGAAVFIHYFLTSPRRQEVTVCL